MLWGGGERERGKLKKFRVGFGRLRLRVTFSFTCETLDCDEMRTEVSTPSAVSRAHQRDLDSRENRNRVEIATGAGRPPRSVGSYMSVQLGSFTHIPSAPAGNRNFSIPPGGARTAPGRALAVSKQEHRG